MSELLFSSDTHFEHKFMADLRSGRYFQADEWIERPSIFPGSADLRAVEDRLERTALMDEIMTEGWNAKVGKNDVVYFLGDLTFGKADSARKMFSALNGRKYLLVGNHDPKFVQDLPWQDVFDFKKISHDKRSIYLMHYPMLTWPNAHKGTWHLHGHSHGNLKAPESTRMDVGPDSTGEIVISIEEVRAIMETREYDFVDHHD